ncbi:hypothetical protein [Methylobacterium sp. SyP6R]|uniref:hypothetical protein n=1 Tax=Methylobacterium sp. SyP6R TaxID=2718876 RepID=UPI002351AE8B|nr:hypothetical protein [Methylobacterium sp. SyP6R]
MSGKRRCRMHGGAQGSGAPQGEANGRYRDGLRTKEAAALRAEVRRLQLSTRDLLGALSGA